MSKSHWYDEGYDDGRKGYTIADFTDMTAQDVSEYWRGVNDGREDPSPVIDDIRPARPNE